MDSIEMNNDKKNEPTQMLIEQPKPILNQPFLSEDVTQKRFEKEILKKYNEALSWLADGNLVKGVSALEQLISDKKITEGVFTNSNLVKFKAACHINLFSSFIELKDIRKAIYHGTQYIKTYPKDYKRLYEIGCILLQNGFLKAGAVMLQKALKNSMDCKEIQFSFLIADKFVDALFIIGDLQALRNIVYHLESLSLFKSQSFSGKLQKVKCLEFFMSNSLDIRSVNLPFEFQNLRYLVDQVETLKKKESIVSQEYWDCITKVTDSNSRDFEIDEGTKNENISIKSLTMLSLLDRVCTILAKSQIVPMRQESNEFPKISKRQSSDAIKINYEDLIKKNFFFEYEKTEKRNRSENNNEIIEEGTSTKLLDDYIVPKMFKILTKPNISYISRLLNEINISVKSMFDFTVGEKVRKRGNANNDKTTCSPLKFEKFRMCADLTNKINGCNLFTILKHLIDDIFEEKKREIQISEKRFLFFGPSIFLRNEFKTSCSDFLKLFNFIFQILPGLLNFETLLVFLECLQSSIQEFSKKGFQKSFFAFFHKLEELYLNLDEEYFTKKTKLYEHYINDFNDQRFSFDEYLRTYANRRIDSDEVLIEENSEDNDLQIVSNHQNNGKRDNFDEENIHVIENNREHKSNKMEIEMESSESQNQPLTSKQINAMLKADIKNRFWKLKRYEQKIKSNSFEKFNEDKVNEFIETCQAQATNLKRSNIDQNCMYWCEKTVLQITPENSFAFLNWIEEFFNLDEIEMIQEIVVIDFTHLYTVKDGEILGLTFLPKLIKFILDFPDKSKKFDGDRFEYAYDVLREFFQLDSQIDFFLKQIKQAEISKTSLPAWISSSNRLFLTLIKLFFVQFFMDKKQHQNDAKLTMKLLLNHTILQGKEKHYFMLYQCFHYIIEYSNNNNQNTPLVNYLCKPMRKVKVLNSINHFFNNIKPEDFVQETKQNSLQGIHLILTEIKRFFECVYQIKLPQAFFTQLIRTHAPENSREISEISKEARAEVPKLRTLCSMNCQDQNSTNEKYTVKNFSESLLLFNILINILSKEPNLEDRLFVQSEPRFGENKVFSSKVFIAIYEDLRIDAGLFNICHKLLGGYSNQIIIDFPNLFSECLKHRKLCHIFQFQNNTSDELDPATKVCAGSDLISEKTSFSECLNFLDKASLIFLIIGIRYLEQELLIKINTGHNLKEINNSFSILADYCSDIFMQKFHNKGDTLLSDFVINAYIRYKYQFAAIEPLDIILDRTFSEANPSLESFETLVLHYLLTIKKVENNLCLLRNLQRFFPGSIEEDRMNKTASVWALNWQKFLPCQNILSVYSSKRIDYVFFFYATDLLIQITEGDIEKIISKLQMFFKDTKEQNGPEYIGTFKPFFEGKKGEKSQVYKIMAYTRILVQLYYWYVRKMEEKLAQQNGSNQYHQFSNNFIVQQIQFAQEANLHQHATQESKNGLQIESQSCNIIPNLLLDKNSKMSAPVLTNFDNQIESMNRQLLDNEKFQSNHANIIELESDSNPINQLSNENNNSTLNQQTSDNGTNNNIIEINDQVQIMDPEQKPKTGPSRTEVIIKEDSVPIHLLTFDEYVALLWVTIQKDLQQKFDTSKEAWCFMLKNIIQNLFKSKNFSSQIFLYDTLEIFNVAFKIHPELSEVFGPDLLNFFESFKKIEIVPKEKDFKTFFFELCMSRKLIFLQFFKDFETMPAIYESLLMSSLKLIKSQDTIPGDLSIINAILPAVVYLVNFPNCQNLEIYKTIWSLRGYFAKHIQKEPCIIYLYNFLIRRMLRFMLAYLIDKKGNAVNVEELKEFDAMCTNIESKPFTENVDLDALLKTYKSCKILIQKHFIGKAEDK